MAENSKIEWTDHTINLWWGCQKVNPACDHCYAETLSRRYDGKGPDGESAIWGARSKRRPIKSWLGNLDKFQRKAGKAGEYHRVFCGSMMDIFEVSKDLTEPYFTTRDEDAPTATTTNQVRDLFFEQISYNRWPNLIFLLLTKRPGNIPFMVPASWITECPKNVWFGTSIPSQEYANRLIPQLLRAPGTGNKFMSIEPLLGPLDLSRSGGTQGQNISWVIAGGESGHNARPMHPDWVRSLRDQCKAAGVPFHFKQWGEYAPVHSLDCNKEGIKGNLWHVFDPDTSVCRVGKKAAGRLLDGQEWNELPESFK